MTPSGRLPDTWAANFQRDPTFPNQDDGSDRFLYENAFTTMVSAEYWQDMARTPFREYEEGVYLGYRYYETAWEEKALTDFLLQGERRTLPVRPRPVLHDLPSGDPIFRGGRG